MGGHERLPRHAGLTVPVVIPAAGLGTRLARLTGGAPKELVELGGRPAILGALLEAAHAGSPRVVIVTAARKPQVRVAVEQLVDELDLLRSLSLEFVEQPEPRGVLDAVDRAASSLDTDRLAVVFPDFIASPHQRSLAALLAADLPPDATGYGIYRRTEANAALVGPSTALGGALDRNLLRATGLGVGPWHTALVELQGTEHRQRASRADGDLPGLLAQLAAEGRLVGVPIPGEVLDVGIPAGFEHARRRFTEGAARWAVAR